MNTLVRIPVRLVLPVLLIALLPQAVQAQEPTPEPAQREHVVRRGDTLWDLARAYLQNPFLWPVIYDANRAVVENPHLIYPQERLIIPPLQPVRAGEPLGRPPAVLVEAEPLPEQPAEVADADSSTLVATLDLRRPIVPLAEYLAAPWLGVGPDRNVVGRIGRHVAETAASDRLPSTLHPNDRVHVATEPGHTLQNGDSLLIVRFGRRIGDWGRTVEPLGVIRVERGAGAAVEGRVIAQFGDARVGDVMLRVGAVPRIGLGAPEPVEGGVEGRLLEFVRPDPMQATTDRAFISLGRNAGVGIGDEFAVYVPAHAPDAAPVMIATARVVRVDDSTSTVRVLTVNSTALQGGLPIRLVRRMP